MYKLKLETSWQAQKSMNPYLMAVSYTLMLFVAAVFLLPAAKVAFGDAAIVPARFIFFGLIALTFWAAYATDRKRRLKARERVRQGLGRPGESGELER